MTVVFDLVRSIVFDTFRSLNFTSKGSIFLFSAVLILGDTRIHVGLMNDGNVASYIEVMVGKSFSYWSILGVPDVNSNNSYIWLERNFDDTKSKSNVDVFENMSGFDY